MFRVSSNRLEKPFWGTSPIDKLSWRLLCNKTQRRKNVIKYSLSSSLCTMLLWLLDPWASAGSVFISYNKTTLQIALWTSAHCRALSDISCVVLMGWIKTQSVPSVRKRNFNLNVSFPEAQILLVTEPALICVILLGAGVLFLKLFKLVTPIGSVFSFKWGTLRIMWHIAIYKRLKQSILMWALQLIAWTNYT